MGSHCVVTGIYCNHISTSTSIVVVTLDYGRSCCLTVCSLLEASLIEQYAIGQLIGDVASFTEALGVECLLPSVSHS